MKDYKELEITQSSHSYIKYRLYNNNTAVLMGSYTNRKYRKLGLWSKNMDFLIKSLPCSCTLYACVENPILMNYFSTKGFERAQDPAPFWGNPTNCINFKITIK